MIMLDLYSAPHRQMEVKVHMVGRKGGGGASTHGAHHGKTAVLNLVLLVFPEDGLVTL